MPWYRIGETATYVVTASYRTSAQQKAAIMLHTGRRVRKDAPADWKRAQWRMFGQGSVRVVRKVPA